MFEYSGARYVGVHVGETACASPGCPALLDLGKEVENRTLAAAGRSRHVTVPISARGAGRALLDEVDLHVLVPAAP